MERYRYHYGLTQGLHKGSVPTSGESALFRPSLAHPGDVTCRFWALRVPKYHHHPVVGDRQPLPVARATAVAAWLVTHAIVAWSLRARPALRRRDNPALPAWVLLAAGAAVVLGGPAASAVGLQAVTPGIAIAFVAALAIGCLRAIRARLRFASTL